MKIKFFERFDYLIIVCIVILSAMGVAFIYSSAIDSSGVLQNLDYRKQSVWCAVGMSLMIVATIFDYRLFKRYAIPIGIILVVSLIATRLFGKTVNNSKSWLGFYGLGIQPSEPGKILFILFMAWFLERSDKDNPLKRFFLALCFTLIPMGLILLQNDMGTALVYFPIFFVMCYIAHVPLRYLLPVLFCGILTIVFIMVPLWQQYILQKPIYIVSVLRDKTIMIAISITLLLIIILSLLGYRYTKKKYFYWIIYVCSILLISYALAYMGLHVLTKEGHKYQRNRLLVYLKSDYDVQVAGYNVTGAKIAIGSGGMFGQGFKMGNQSHLKFVPEQSTDFIFSIISEEIGFIGGLIVFSCFLLIFLRIVIAARTTSNLFGSYICSGVLGMLFFHFLVNIGMDIGLMPVMGIPLPFVSYGGSAYITNCIAMGLVMSVASRKLDFGIMNSLQ
ncbi:MAG: rod shape-determining protein RodA [Treponema sp.]|nr:rod shape-determining protein RodA [Treponema sp.]